MMITVKTGNTEKSWKREHAPKAILDAEALAKQEDEPIKQDVDFVALTASGALMDTDDLAQTVIMLMGEIDQLRMELEELKNG